MLSHTDLKKGILFLLNGQPHQVLDYALNFQGRGGSTVTVKIHNLINGNTLNKTLHPADQFEEAEVTKKDLRFLYANRGQYYFTEADSPAKRFFLTAEQIGSGASFLTANQIVKGLFLNDEVVTIELPIKAQLKVIEAPPGIKAGRAESGTKLVTLEGGGHVQAPLFVAEGDLIEINTQTAEYVKRINEE